MNTPSAPTDPTSDGTSDPVSDASSNPPFDTDLHDLAVEIVVNTGVSLATAHFLARLQRPALAQYAQQRDARAKRSLTRTRRRRHRG
jgi:hypothetical protein